MQSQLPSECDYLLRILKFMLTLKQSGETATIIQTFICKHNCTINRLELNVVLEEKLHGLDALSPDKLSLHFIYKKPLQLKTLSA